MFSGLLRLSYCHVGHICYVDNKDNFCPVNHISNIGIKDFFFSRHISHIILYVCFYHISFPVHTVHVVNFRHVCPFNFIGHACHVVMHVGCAV